MLGPGQAVLYAAPWRDFEVQVRTFNTPSVHCAIAAREGNNIMKFNYCPGDSFGVQIDFKSEASLQPKITQVGTRYRVCQCRFLFLMSVYHDIIFFIFFIFHFLFFIFCLFVITFLFP